MGVKGDKDEMNIGYCIICHSNNNILRTTIEILSEDNDIYLHVDKKTDIKNFDEYNDRVHFINDRINVIWGHYSMIECMLKLMREARKADYDYICLLSGDCLPLKDSNGIKEFFIDHRGKEFIGIQKNYNTNQLINHVKYRYSSIYLKKDKNLFETILSKVEKATRSLRVNHGYEKLPQLYKGCVWFSISREFCNYIFEYLQENDWFVKAFLHTGCADEVFFQTIVMNSKYKDRVYGYDSEEDDNRMALRYIDWNSKSSYPKTLTEDDFEKIKLSNCLFGRKFDSDLDIDKFKTEFDLDI